MDIEQIADELKMLATTGTKVPGVRRKILVDIDRLVSLGDDLRRTVPVSMQEAEEVLRQKESIINLANLEAQRIRGSADQDASTVTADAQRQHAAKVGDSEILKAAEAKGQEIKEEAMYEAQQIVQDAQRKAYRIISDSEAAAGTRREGADQYSKEVLFNLEEELADVLSQVRRGIDALKLDSPASKPQPSGAEPNQVPA